MGISLKEGAPALVMRTILPGRRSGNAEASWHPIFAYKNGDLGASRTLV
jgi:hypothetical protein